jgi:hypothetical protein
MSEGQHVGYGTRSNRQAAIVDGWRSDVLAGVTKPSVWIVLAVAYVALLGIATSVAGTLAGPAMALFATAIAWYTLLRLRKHDQQRRWLAQLTPVTDRSTLSGEVTILKAAIEALIATLGNPRATAGTRQQAIQQVLSAGAPLMLRGNVTVETATVAGYPQWPEVDCTEMPGKDGDFVSLHVMRLGATMSNLERMANERLVFEETVGRTAGEIVPPLRAIDAAIAKAGR